MAHPTGDARALLTSGAFVTLHSLNARPQLNLRHGLILRTNEVPHPVRHLVYLPPSADTHLEIVRAKPHNIAVRHVAPCATAPAPAPRPVLTLAKRKIADFATTHTRAVLTAFGDEPPLYLFPGVSAAAKSAKVLLFASADIRSALYSLARDDVQRTSPVRRNVLFSFSETEPGVIARHLVILWLMTKGHASAETIFEVWFSLRLEQSSYVALVNAVLALTGPASDAVLREMHVSFRSEFDKQKTLAVMPRWIAWQDRLGWQHICDQRARFVREHTGQTIEKRANAMQRATAAKYNKCGDDKFPLDAASAEQMSYMTHGVVCCNNQPMFVNPTLFLRPDAYSLHHSSNPFACFPSFAPQYHADKPLLNVCLAELERWRQALAQHGRHVSWRFTTEDFFAVATSTDEVYDVIATHKLADTVGLLPLLQALRGLLSPGGTLLTQAAHTEPCHDRYLERTSLLRNEFFPSMLGWRCIGYEGPLSPPNHVVDFKLYDFAQTINSESNRAPETKTLKLTWVPASKTNVPVHLPAQQNVCDALVSLRANSAGSASLTWRVQEPVDPSDRSNLLSLLPICFKNEGALRLFDEKNPADVEMVDLLHYLQGTKNNDMMLATVNVQREEWVEFAETCDDHADVCFLMECNDGQLIPYTGIHAVFDEARDLWQFSWLIIRDRLNATKNIRIKSRLRRKDIQTSNCESRLVRRAELATWKSRMKHKKSGIIDVGGNDSGKSWKVRLKARRGKPNSDHRSEQLTVKKTIGQNSITLTSGKAEFELQLPGPVQSAELQWRPHGECILDIEKSCYKSESEIRNDIWISDYEAFAPAQFNEESKAMFAESQLTMTERFKMSSLEENENDPLFSLKKAITLLLKKPELQCFHLIIDSKPSVPAGLIIHHGMRREHRTGTPFLDISVCILDEHFAKQEPELFFPRFNEVETHLVLSAGGMNLLRDYVTRCCFRLKVEGRPLDQPEQNHIEDESLRKFFHRVLIPPLLSKSTFNKK